MDVLGSSDTAQAHPEEVDKETVAQWLRSITRNKDNPRGAKQILPFDAKNSPGEVKCNLSSALSFTL